MSLVIEYFDDADWLGGSVYIENLLPIKNEHLSLSSVEVTQHSAPGTQLLSIPDYEETRHELRKLMWEKVGIIRCGESLGYAKKKFEEWSFIQKMSPLTRRDLELQNMQVVAHLITEASLQRKGSVGAHYRSDYPEREEEWEKHTAWRMRDGELICELVE